MPEKVEGCSPSNSPQLDNEVMSLSSGYFSWYNFLICSGAMNPQKVRPWESNSFWSVSVVYDRAFFEAIDLPDSQKSFLPLCSHSEYMKAMSACDFAFLPLLDTPFNRLKSDLKAVEAASCGLAALASSVVYQESIQSGETGELFNSASEMVSCLQSWRNNPQQVRVLGAAGLKWVQEKRMFAYQVQDRENWYRSLVAQRDQLTRELLERVPQLIDQ